MGARVSCEQDEQIIRDHQVVESKWQTYWETHRPFRASDDPSKPKFYCLDMFRIPLGPACTSGTWKGTPPLTSSPGINGCAGLMCCIPWAGTRLDCRLNSMP